MNRDQARARADERNGALPNGADHHWMAHDHGEGRWDVVRVSAAGLRFRDGSRQAHAEAPTEPPVDPRPSIIRAIPPVGPNQA